MKQKLLIKRLVWTERRGMKNVVQTCFCTMFLILILKWFTSWKGPQFSETNLWKRVNFLLLLTIWNNRQKTYLATPPSFHSVNGPKFFHSAASVVESQRFKSSGTHSSRWSFSETGPWLLLPVLLQRPAVLWGPLGYRPPGRLGGLWASCPYLSQTAQWEVHLDPSRICCSIWLY